MSMTDTYAPTSGVESALARARLGAVALVSNVMAAAAPLTVVAGGATAGFAITAALGIPLAYLVVAVILAIFSVGYVAMSRQVVNAGAFYTYIAHGLGKICGVSSAFVAVAAYNTMQVGLYGGFGVVTDTFASRFDVNAPWWAWSGLAWLAIAVFGGRRVDHLARLLTVLLIAEVVIALILAAVQVSHPAGGVIGLDTLDPGNLIGPGLGAALATAIAGFVGFEGTAVYSEETKDARRTVPRATYAAVAGIGLLYAFCAFALATATGPANIVQRSTLEGAELTFNLAAAYLPTAVITLGNFLFVSSLFAALLAFHNNAARYHFALGREGVLPAVLGRTSAKTKAPIAGSILQSVIGFAGIALFVINAWKPFEQMFFWLTVLGGFGVLILMTVTSLAVAAYFTRRRNRDRVGTRVGAVRGILAPAIAFLLLGAVAMVTVRQFATLLGVSPDDPVRWLLPTGYAAAAAVGLLWALCLRATRPAVWARIGLGAHQNKADMIGAA
ncbi:APC family permease [Actinoplanes sp. NPDC051633]|uniref:APC family permease n=1 Tax=Actinoplanes sp. NPDC051633 TaxID=3155670 RepID=UPI0034163369